MASLAQVLVVDDDPTIRACVSLLLESAGYDVAEAEDGIEALLFISKNTPDVVVPDLNMPRMSGFDLLSEVQRRFPQIEFVWLMGSDNLEQFSRWKRWECSGPDPPIAVIQRPGSILAALNAPLVRRFGMVRDPQGSMRAPFVMVLDGARNSESATRLRALRLLGR